MRFDTLFVFSFSNSSYRGCSDRDADCSRDTCLVHVHHGFTPLFPTPISLAGCRLLLFFIYSAETIEQIGDDGVAGDAASGYGVYKSRSG